MLTFENRTSSAFSQQTLLTSYPAGGGGTASNIFVPGGVKASRRTAFAMGKVGYANPAADFSADGYFYGVSDIVNMWWFDGKYTFQKLRWRRSSRCKAASRATPGNRISGRSTARTSACKSAPTSRKNIRITAGYDSIPWQTDTVFFPRT